MPPPDAFDRASGWLADRVLSRPAGLALVVGYSAGWWAAGHAIGAPDWFGNRVDSPLELLSLALGVWVPASRRRYEPATRLKLDELLAAIGRAAVADAEDWPRERIEKEIARRERPGPEA